MRTLVERTLKGCEDLQVYVRGFALPPRFRQARGLFLVARSARIPTKADHVSVADGHAALEQLQSLLGFTLDPDLPDKRHSQDSGRPVLRMRKTSVGDLIRAAVATGQSPARIKRGTDLSQSDEVFLDCLPDLAGTDRALRVCAEAI